MIGNTSDTLIAKTTVVPLQMTDLELRTPFVLLEHLTIENVTGMLKREHFDLWRDYLSKRERDDFPNLRVAIVHRFHSAEHIGREEENSKYLAYRVFKALRLLKPSGSRYAAIQYKTGPTGETDIFSFTHPLQLPVLTPDSETLNQINQRDLQLLRETLPSFLKVEESGSEPLRRSIHYYETGYGSIQDRVIQYLTWLMGIEAAVSDSQTPLLRSNVIRRILERIDPNTTIYAESPLNEYFTMPQLRVVDVLPDLFRLRSRLVHGGQIPDWRPDISRRTLQGRVVTYAEMLFEAAPVVLRKLILASVRHAAA